MNARPCEAEHPNAAVPGCWWCWLAANDWRWQRKWGLAVTAPEVRPAPPDWVRRGGGEPPPAQPAPSLARPDRCEHLGKRTEHKHGCGGMRCRHACDLGLPAVPGEYCQTCTSYKAEDGEPWM